MRVQNSAEFDMWLQRYGCLGQNDQKIIGHDEIATSMQEKVICRGKVIGNTVADNIGLLGES